MSLAFRIIDGCLLHLPTMAFTVRLLHFAVWFSECRLRHRTYTMSFELQQHGHNPASSHVHNPASSQYNGQFNPMAATFIPGRVAHPMHESGKSHQNVSSVQKWINGENMPTNMQGDAVLKDRIEHSKPSALPVGSVPGIPADPGTGIVWTFKKSNQANRHTDESSTAPAHKGSVSRKQKGDAVKSWSSGYSDQALNKAEIVRTHALGCRLYQ